jgi:hypothetical protein
MDVLRTSLLTLIENLPAGLEVSMRTFPRGIKVEFTTDLSEIRSVARTLAPCTGRGCGTPLASTVKSIVEQTVKDPRNHGAIALLLTDGMNSDSLSSADAYRLRAGGPVVHTVGFAIEPGGVAEIELSELAAVAGGSYRDASSALELDSVFRSFAGRRELKTGEDAIELRVTQPDYWPTRISSDSLDSVELSMQPKATARNLLTLRRENISELQLARRLSERGKELVKRRLNEGDWTIIIPRDRVNIGPVSAYGWFEIESGTGRVIGRTEDGLHASSAAAPGIWPDADIADLASDFVEGYLEWFRGIVAYTAGSVQGGLQWHRQPSFINGSREDFAEFVQANALEFSARTGGGASYWMGVCLNYEMQSAALQLDMFREECQRLACEGSLKHYFSLARKIAIVTGLSKLLSVDISRSGLAGIFHQAATGVAGLSRQFADGMYIAGLFTAELYEAAGGESGWRALRGASPESDATVLPLWDRASNAVAGALCTVGSAASTSK